MKTFTKNAAAAMVLAVLATLPVTAGGAKDSSGDSISYGIATEPDHLDPFQAISADSRVVLFNVFEGLFKPTSSGEIVPAVASAFSVSPDNKTYTVTLRERVFFHNGEPVTMEDVVYSLQKSIDSKLLTGVTVFGMTPDGKLEIKLTEPNSEFQYSLATLNTAIVPKGYNDQNTFPIGTGPFKFVSFTPQQEVVLEKNEQYWQPGLPKVGRFTFKIKADYNSILLDLKAKTLDAGTIESVGALQLSGKDYTLVYDNINAPQIFALNNKAAPFTDIRVRQAVEYAVNVDEIVKLVHQGHAERAASPVIPALKKAYAKDLDTAYTFNVTKAKALLKEAGLEQGFDMTIKVPSNYEPHVQTAEVLVNQLGAVGIRVKVQLVDWATWLSEVYTARNYEGTVISLDGTTLSPRSYLARYESTHNRNFINYSSKEYDALWARALQSQNQDERTDLYKQLQRVLSADAASVFICDISSPKVFRKGIQGYTSYPLYVFDASTLSVK